MSGRSSIILHPINGTDQTHRKTSTYLLEILFNYRSRISFHPKLNEILTIVNKNY